jgi:DNA repair photolyase
MAMELPVPMSNAPWMEPSEVKSVEYRLSRVQTLLRPQVEDGGWFWSLDSYEGCELGCAFCPTTLEGAHPARVLVKVNAALVLRHALRTQGLEGRPIVLGHRTEPWQPLEERFRITRGVLETLAERGGVELRVNTRSRRVTRDVDLLRAIGERGRVSVTFSLPSLDDGLNRLLEPKAPPVAERLAAMELLAHAGLKVGVLLSPVPPGLSPEALGLAALLSQAREAGACFAGLRWLDFTPGQRERFVARASPALVERLAERQGGAPARDVLDAFEASRGRLGLQSYEEVMALRPWPPVPPAPEPHGRPPAARDALSSPSARTPGQNGSPRAH